MNDRELAQIMSLGRLTIGLALFVAPRRSIQAWLGEPDPEPGTIVMTRSTGGRDVAIAIGTMVGLDRGSHVTEWLQAGALGDAADLVAGLGQWRAMPAFRRLLFFGATTGSIMLGLRLATALED